MMRTARCLLALALALVVSTPVLIAQTTLPSHVVALSGMASPAGPVFDDFIEAYILEDGTVWFEAISDGGSGWWLRTPDGVLRAIIHTNDAVPGLPDASFSDITVRVVSVDHIIVHATLSGSPRAAVFSGQPGNWTVLVQESDTVTPTFQTADPPITYTVSNMRTTSTQISTNGGHTLLLNDRNLYVVNPRVPRGYGGFLGLRSDGTHYPLLFSFNATALPALGGEESALISATSTRTVGPVLNAQGQTVLLYTYDGPDVVQNKQAIIRTGLDESFTVLASGDESDFVNIRSLTINQNGQVAALGQLPGGPAGIWSSAGGTMQNILAIGDATLGGRSFEAFTSVQPLASGQLVFRARLSADAGGTSRDGLWVQDGTTIRPLQVEGDQASALGPDAVFGPVPYTALHESGHLAAWNGSFAGDNGLWVGSTDGLKLRARPGDQVELLPGDVRTVASLPFPSPVDHFQTGSNGLPGSITSTGTLVFRVQFTDGSSALVTDLPRASGLTINSTADDADANPGDGRCDTGLTNSLNEPACTLRAALEEAQSQGPNQAISFAIPTDESGYDSASGTFTIPLTRALPVVMTPLALDGRTQPGFDATPLVAVDGSSINEAAPGLRIEADGVTLAGLAWVRFASDGLHLAGANSTQLSHVWLGRHPAASDGIWGNAGAGLRLTDNATATTVTHSMMANNGEAGLLIVSGSGNAIGSGDADDQNTITNNGSDGIHIISGTGNRIGINSIRDNAGLGINLDNDGNPATEDTITRNDLGDADSGANALQNYPQIVAVQGETVEGVLESIPNTTFTLHLYANPRSSDSTPAEGASYLTTTIVQTDASGEATFSVTVPNLSPAALVTATATDPSGNTSEFSIPPLIVNSTGDAPDATAGDGFCDTGQTVQRNDVLEPECTLRAVLEEANTAGERESIRFNIPGAAPYTIVPTQALPAITAPLDIDATTQPNYAPETPVVRLFGQNAGTASGLTITNDGAALRGLVVSNFAEAGIQSERGSLLLEDIHLLRNGQHGLHAAGDVMATGLVLAEHNGAAFTDPVSCTNRDISALFIRGTFQAEDLTLRSTCGSGLIAGPETTINGNIEATQNTGAGIDFSGNLGPSRQSGTAQITGEQHVFSHNGHEGLRAGIFDAPSTATATINVEITGDVIADENGQRAGLCLEHAAQSATTLRAGLSVRGHLAVTGNLGATANCGWGVQSDRLTVQGDVIATTNRVDGISTTNDVRIEGQQHDISDNWGSGVTSINATSQTSHSIYIAGQRTRIHGNAFRADWRQNAPSTQEECERIHQYAGGIGAEGSVYIEHAEVTENCGLGIAVASPSTSTGNPTELTLAGNSTIRFNTFGIDGANKVRFLEGDHDVSLNQFYAVGGNEIRVDGSLTAINNNRWYRDHAPEQCRPGGLAAALLGITSVTGRNIRVDGNCGDGISGGNSTLFATSIDRLQTVANTGHGIEAMNVLINNTTATHNEGYGVVIQGGRYLLRTSEISRNRLGGVLGADPDRAVSGKTDPLANQTLQIPEPFSRIEGSRIQDNGSAGLRVDGGLPVLVTDSEIQNNMGFAIESSASVPVTAERVWWGTSSVPTAALSPTVTAPAPRSHPLSLTVAAGADTVYLAPGTPDTLSLTIRHWQTPTASVNLSLEAAAGWLASPSSTVLDLDTLGITHPLLLQAPTNANLGESTTLRILSTNGTQRDTLSITLIAGLPATNHPPTVLVAPPPQTVVVGPSTPFAALLSSYFHDADGDPLTYAITVQDPALANATSGADRLTVTFNQVGTATIVVTATDPSGAQTALTLELTGILGTPLLSQPSPLSTDIEPDTPLVFTPVEAATAYQLQIAEQANFAQAWVDTTFAAPASQAAAISRFVEIAVPLPTAPTLSWRVRALQNEFRGPWSDTLQFSVTTSVHTTSSSVPSVIHLAPNTPNPFNHRTTIAYTLPQAMDITLTVYDMLGRHIRTLDQGWQSSGMHYVSFDAVGLASGIYLYRLQAGAQNLSRTMTLQH